MKVEAKNPLRKSSNERDEPASDDEDESVLNCCHDWGNGWRQFMSVMPGIMLLFSSGFHYVYSVYELDALTREPIIYQKVPENVSNYTSTINEYPLPEPSDECPLMEYRGYSVVVFYVAAAVGHWIGAPLNRALKKRHIYYIASVLQVVSGVLFLFRIAIVDRCMFLSRIVMGLAYGLAYLTVTVHTSDIASRSMRKQVTLFVVVMNAIGIAANAYYSRLDYPEWKFVGYFLIYTGVSALVSTPFFCLEPPTYYLLRKKESEALRHFTKLNNERKPSRRTSEKFAELELMVKEDVQNGHNILTGGNFRSLWIVFLGKLMALATSNVSIVWIMCRWSTRFQFSGDSNFTSITLIQTGLGALALVFSQCGGHRFIYVLTILFSSTLLFLGVLPFCFEIEVIPDRIFQLISLIGLSTLSLAANYYQLLHSMEAFTVTKKAWSIASLSIIEHLIHIAVMPMFELWNSHFINVFVAVFSICTFIVLFVSSIFLFVMVPSKIKGLSVRGIRSRFNKHLGKITRRRESSV